MGTGARSLQAKKTNKKRPRRKGERRHGRLSWWCACTALARSIQRKGAHSCASYAASRCGRPRRPGGRYRTRAGASAGVARGGHTAIVAAGRYIRRRARAILRRLAIPCPPLLRRQRRGRRRANSGPAFGLHCGGGEGGGTGSGGGGIVAAASDEGAIFAPALVASASIGVAMAFAVAAAARITLLTKGKTSSNLACIRFCRWA